MTESPRHGSDRHTLVWLRPGADTDPSAGWRDTVADWIRAGRPFVGRRRSRDDPADAVALGLPLPPCRGKHRVALTASPADVIGRAPPLPLREALDRVDLDLGRPVEEFVDAAAASGITVRVFGSVAWQALTGEPYVAAGSDIDLLVAPEDRCQLARATELLVACDAETEWRLDGEMIFPGGRAVAWREFALTSSQTLLVKTDDDARLEERDALVRRLDRANGRKAS